MILNRIINHGRTLPSGKACGRGGGGGGSVRIANANAMVNCILISLHNKL